VKTIKEEVKRETPKPNPVISEEEVRRRQVEAAKTNLDIAFLLSSANTIPTPNEVKI
jgi:hypothetical protein